MGACASFTSQRPPYVGPDPSATESTTLDENPPSRLFDISMDVYEFLDRAHGSIPENATVIHSRIPRQPFRLLMLGKFVLSDHALVSLKSISLLINELEFFSVSFQLMRTSS